MTDADARLKRLFAEDEPPARDPAFSTAVMAEIARRRFVVDMILLSVATVTGAVVLWATWPGLRPALPALSQGLLPVVACLTLAVTAVLMLDRRVGAAAPPES